MHKVTKNKIFTPNIGPLEAGGLLPPIITRTKVWNNQNMMLKINFYCRVARLAFLKPDCSFLAFSRMLWLEKIKFGVLLYSGFFWLF